MKCSPAPALVVLAGIIHLRITVVMLAFLVAPHAAAAPGGWQPASAETIQLRLGALADDPKVAGVAVADPWLLARFYEQQQFSAAWHSPAKLESLLEAVAGSHRHGLLPADYHHETLTGLLGSHALAPSAELAAKVDILATDALARLAFHLRFGKVDPVQLESSWNFSRRLDGISPVAALSSLVNAERLGDALDGLVADSDYYRGLKAALAEYRELAAQGGWPRVPEGETLRPGMESPRVIALRARLAVTGDHPTGEADAAPEVFDPTLEAAVRRFQHRHGLDIDGIVGRNSLAALNVSAAARVDQLRVNMERARWVFDDLEERFLLVNIARFRVILIERGRVTWSTRAVVGRPYRQTPVFRARMTYLEFNPTWTVPPTILRQDLLPELRRDPDALQRKNMVVLDFQGQPVDPAGIDWATIPARGFPYMIRQEPGPDNALGRVKFMYPNPHHVYMHDTPARALFGRAERAFSSGCIRLEKPFELVNILLAGSEWDEAALGQMLASGRTRVVNLPQPITVLTLYGTAAPEGDEIHFAADIYRRDARLLAALDAPFVFSPPAGYQETVWGSAPP
jgi:L,D-transpeptidase YcbB